MILARGKAGEVRVGHIVAAHLGRWQLDLDDTALAAVRWTVSAELVLRDDYWIEHIYAFDLYLFLGGQAWRWRNIEIVVGNSVTARGEGRPEVVDL